jgi:hypothetical protein
MSTSTPEPLTSAEPSFNYLAHYSFAFPQSDLRPEDQRWGQGSMPINTDKEPKTKEEFLEIARTIGKTGGYERVAITKLEPTDHFIIDKGEILEGLIVND